MDTALTLALPQFQKLLVILMRVAGLVSAWPVLRSRTIPAPLKAAFVVALSFILLPIVPVPGAPADPVLATVGLGSEFLVGLVLGLGVRFVFEGINLAGELMGMQMGLGSVQLIDPTASNQVPLVSNFNTIIASLVFLSLNGHMLVVQAIGDSFHLVPPFGAGVSPVLLNDVLVISQGMFTLALKISAPIMVTILLINIGMAILGRAVPQMNVFVLSFPVTIAGGLLVMGASLPFVVSLMQSEFHVLPETVGGLLRDLGAQRMADR